MKNKNVKTLTKRIKEMEAAKKELEREMLFKIGKITFTLYQDNFDIVKLKNDVDIIVKEYGFEKDTAIDEKDIIAKQPAKDKSEDKSV